MLNNTEAAVEKGKQSFLFCCCFFLLGKLWSCSPTLGKSLTGNHYTSGKKADIKKVCVFAYDCVWGGAVCWGSPYNPHFIQIYTQLRFFFFCLFFCTFSFLCLHLFFCVTITSESWVSLADSRCYVISTEQNLKVYTELPIDVNCCCVMKQNH